MDENAEGKIFNVYAFKVKNIKPSFSKISFTFTLPNIIVVLYYTPLVKFPLLQTVKKAINYK